MRSILIISIFLLSVCGSAIEAGPYNISVGLQGFNAISAVGPIEATLPDVHASSYMVGIAAGNSTTPSNEARRISLEITKFNLPFDITNAQFLRQSYDTTANNVYPLAKWDLVNDAMIDGKLSNHRRNDSQGIDFLCYFANGNTKVTIGSRNLSSEEFTVLLRSFHIDGI